MNTDMSTIERALLDARVVAVVRHARADAAAAIARACVAGGLRAIEVTLTTPDAHRLVAELHDELGAEVLVGAGTILRADQVGAIVAAGARFLVAPITDEAALDAGREAGVVTIPGGMTPTEIAAAHARGARIVKLFPAGQLGPGFARAIRDVLPGVALMPTGGVGEADVAAWLDAGAGAVGIGSQLNRALADGGPAAVEALATRLATHVASAGDTAAPASDRSPT
ncbi:bifunctional 4-hydroxy-2-oxoglutarate aldolase/2-dehydro-3-deoxy-phosphogluconate aldolase [Nitriliruptoraceae bacterium ZYF776]|nr:bifunctional 4-hydroxy-2-oxoglutarate aldolase/2-dehydro-3-deoxy-phosphogluconate aldolase [Profundirhabdus halotolerans]